MRKSPFSGGFFFITEPAAALLIGNQAVRSRMLLQIVG
jgi:hypothetical protein